MSLHSSSASGREAAIARRRALSAGKAALPAAKERHRSSSVRDGSVAVPPPALSLVSAPTENEAPPADPVKAALPDPVRQEPPRPELLGRLRSIERRRRLSAGKAALPPPTERVRNGERSAILPSAPRSQATVVPSAPQGEPPAQAASAVRGASSASSNGKRLPASALRSRKFREAELNYAPKVIESITQRRQVVTGVRLGSGSQVTGHDAGMSLPVSGTQYIGSQESAAARSAGPKVGLSRTPQGGVVSGTMTRSKVRVTGDESCSCKITGESEQCPEDDITERPADDGVSLAQFQRQPSAHGQAMFGANMGTSGNRRSAVGSRERQRQSPIESTWRGQTITGSAVGRASRITGDEDGACKHVTGDQYLTPARGQAECGGIGGGTAPPEQLGAPRRDPVTAGKVSETQTWARQRVTGCNIDFSPSVTGNAPGTCSIITGTPYLGQGTVQGWCDPETTAEAGKRLHPRAPNIAVTGDTPIHDADVTGTARGALRSITGTPYSYQESTDAPRELGVAALDGRFSVHSPQRSAHLKMDHALIDLPSAAARITGSFAVGEKKVTGNLEFLFRPRRDPSAESKAAHARLSGEGSTAGQRISGSAYGAHGRVTGTEGDTAAERNPSHRNGNGRPQPFAGASRFKAQAKPEKQEDRKQLVTGMFGWSSKSAAKVTLSGGAQG